MNNEISGKTLLSVVNASIAAAIIPDTPIVSIAGATLSEITTTTTSTTTTPTPTPTPTPFIPSSSSKSSSAGADAAASITKANKKDTSSSSGSSGNSVSTTSSSKTPMSDVAAIKSAGVANAAAATNTTKTSDCDGKSSQLEPTIISNAAGAGKIDDAATPANTTIDTKKSDVSDLEEPDLKKLLEEAYTYKTPKDKKDKSEIFLDLLQKVENEDRDITSARSDSHRHHPHSQSRHQQKQGGSLQDLLQLPSDYRRQNHTSRHKKNSSVSSRQREGGSLPSNVNVANCLLNSFEQQASVYADKRRAFLFGIEATAAILSNSSNNKTQTVGSGVSGGTNFAVNVAPGTLSSVNAGIGNSTSLSGKERIGAAGANVVTNSGGIGCGSGGNMATTASGHNVGSTMATGAGIVNTAMNSANLIKNSGDYIINIGDMLDIQQQQQILPSKGQDGGQGLPFYERVDIDMRIPRPTLHRGADVDYAPASRSHHYVDEVIRFHQIDGSGGDNSVGGERCEGGEVAISVNTLGNGLKSAAASCSLPMPLDERYRSIKSVMGEKGDSANVASALGVKAAAGLAGGPNGGVGISSNNPSSLGGVGGVGNNTSIGIGNYTKSLPLSRQIDENGNDCERQQHSGGSNLISSSVGQSQAKAKAKKKPQKDNTIPVDVENEAGYRGKDPVEVLVKFIESTEEDGRQGGSGGGGSGNNSKFSENSKKKERKKEKVKQNKMKKSNSLEELRSCAKIDVGELKQTAATTESNNVTMRSKGSAGGGNKGAKNNSASTADIDKNFVDGGNKEVTAIAAAGKHLNAVATATSPTTATSTTGSTNNRKSERRSWGTEELQYLGADGGIGSTANVEEKVKEKKERKNKEKEKEKEKERERDIEKDKLNKDNREKENEKEKEEKLMNNRMDAGKIEKAEKLGEKLEKTEKLEKRKKAEMQTTTTTTTKAAQMPTKSTTHTPNATNSDHQGNAPVASTIDLLSMNTLISETAEFHVVTKKKKPKKQRASIDDTHFTPGNNYNNSNNSSYNYNNNNNNSGGGGNNLGMSGGYSSRAHNSMGGGGNTQKGGGNNTGNQQQQQQQQQQHSRYRHYNNNNSGDGGRVDYHNNYNSNYNNYTNHAHQQYGGGGQNQSQYQHHHHHHNQQQQQQQHHHQQQHQHHQHMNAHNTSAGSSGGGGSGGGSSSTDKSRRKSTSSVPPSEKSDSSDIDSVHSLPIESTKTSTASSTSNKNKQRHKSNSSNTTTTPETPKSVTSSSGSPGSVVAPISYAHIAAAAAVVDRWPNLDVINNNTINSSNVNSATANGGSMATQVAQVTSSAVEQQQQSHQQQPQHVTNVECSPPVVSSTSLHISGSAAPTPATAISSTATNPTTKTGKSKKMASKPDFPELVATNAMNATTLIEANKSTVTPGTVGMGGTAPGGALKVISYSQSLVAASAQLGTANNPGAGSVEKVIAVAVEVTNVPAPPLASSHNAQEANKADVASSSSSSSAPATRLPQHQHQHQQALTQHQQQQQQQQQQLPQQTLQKSKSVEHDSYSYNSSNLDQQYPALEKTVKRHSTTNVSSITAATAAQPPQTTAGPNVAGSGGYGTTAPSGSSSAVPVNTAIAGKFNFAAAAKQLPPNKGGIGIGIGGSQAITTAPLNTQQEVSLAATGAQLTHPPAAAAPLTTSSTTYAMPISAAAGPAPANAAATRKVKEKSPTIVFATRPLTAGGLPTTKDADAGRKTKKEKNTGAGGEHLASVAQKSSTATQTQATAMDVNVAGGKAALRGNPGSGSETQTLIKTQRPQTSKSSNNSAADGASTSVNNPPPAVNRPAVIILNDDRSADGDIEFTFGDFNEDELKFFDDTVAGEDDCADEYNAGAAYDDEAHAMQQKPASSAADVAAQSSSALPPPLAKQEHPVKREQTSDKMIAHAAAAESATNVDEAVDADKAQQSQKQQPAMQRSDSETRQLQQLETCNEIESAIIAAARAAAAEHHPQPQPQPQQMQQAPLPQQQQQQQQPQQQRSYRHNKHQQQYRQYSGNNAYEPPSAAQREHRSSQSSSSSSYTRDTPNHYQQHHHNYHNQYHYQNQQQQQQQHYNYHHPQYHHQQHQQHHHQSGISNSASRSRSSSSNNNTNVNSFDAAINSPNSPSPSNASTGGGVMVNIQQRKDLDIHFIPPTLSSAQSVLQHNEIIVDFIGSAWEEVSKVTKFYEGQ